MRVKICRRGNTGLPDFGHFFPIGKKYNFFPIGKKYNFFWVGYSIPIIISMSKGISTSHFES